VDHTSKHYYLNLQNNLTTEKYSSFRPGVYCFPFSFYLPRDLPSSFSYHGDDSASINYSIDVEAKTVGAFTSNLDSKKPFTVFQILNTTSPDSPMTERVSAELTFMCCFGRGQMSGFISIPRKRYNYGEEFPVTFAIDNSQSFVDIRNFVFKLSRNVKFYCEGHSHSSKELVHMYTSKGIAKGQKIDDMQVLFTMPSSMSPPCSGADLRVYYTLSVTCVYAWASDVKVDFAVDFFPPSIQDVKLMRAMPMNALVFPLMVLNYAPGEVMGSPFASNQIPTANQAFSPVYAQPDFLMGPPQNPPSYQPIGQPMSPAYGSLHSAVPTYENDSPLQQSPPQYQVQDCNRKLNEKMSS